MFFNIFAQNIDFRYALEPPRRGGCNEFGSQIRKIGIPLQTPVLIYKSGASECLLFIEKFSDENALLVKLHCKKCKLKP